MAKDLNRHDIQMANKHMERCSTSYVIRDCKLRQGDTTTHLAECQNEDNTKCWRGCGATGTLMHCLQEYRKEQPLWKSILPFNPGTTLFGISPNELNT